MSIPRSCNTCRSAKTKCDAGRPSCTRCIRRGQQCIYEADQGLIFRNENEVARLRSNRASRPNQKINFLPLKANTPPAVGQIAVEHDQGPDIISYQGLPWLSRDAQNEVPEPLKRDLRSRAVERFFVNWVLYPTYSGQSPGHLHVIPGLYQSAASNSALCCAVRAIAFADMPKGSRDQVSSFHAQAQRSYGDALARMRDLASDETSLVDDHVLAALLLIDNFELIYLARGEPLGAHYAAFSHILHARGKTQLFSSQSFALWRIAHHRLQAHQILLRRPPDKDQVDWVNRLNIDIPSFHISSDVLQISMLCASARQLMELVESQRITLEGAIEQAEELKQRIRVFLRSLEEWMSTISDPWRPRVVNVEILQKPKDVPDQSLLLVSNQVLQYADPWLAYMWNFHSASQVVLRESFLEVIQISADISGRALNPEQMQQVEEQSSAICRLCNDILESFPPLVGFEANRPSETSHMRQGKMAGKFFALFSMWIIQRAIYSSAEQKRQASKVVEWISTSCAL